MEPERKIEKLLRAYAKKRRADAGDAFKLHPATRRMLQGEVARQSPKPEDEPESLSLWELFRERWAVLLGFALIIFFGATLFLPALSKAKMKSKNVEAMSSLKQIGLAAQIAAVDNRGRLPATLDELTNQLGSRQALTDSVSGQQFVYFAGGAKLDGLHSNDVLAYSPADEKDRAVLFADGSVQRVRREEFLALTNRAQLALALAENSPSRKPAGMPAALAVAAPAFDVAPPVAGVPAGTDGTANGLVAPAARPVSGVASTAGELAAAASSRNLVADKSGLLAQNAAVFKTELVTNTLQFGLNNSQRFVQTATAKTPPVLASFEVQQNGSAISVVDRDGSIYSGTLQPVESALQAERSITKESASKSGLADAANKDLGLAGQFQLAAQNYFFRVSGANRSLQQNVVFSGNLIELTNVTANTAQNSGGGGTIQSAAVKNVQQQLFSNSRITGTVTIGNTNQIEINAVPVNH